MPNYRNLVVVVSLLVVVACDSGSEKNDTTAPTVVATTPVDAATDVVVTDAILVTFDEKMGDGASDLWINSVSVAGSWSVDGLTLTVVPPGVGWTPQTLHQVEVPVTHADVAGNRLARAHTFTFSTEQGDTCVTDMTPPSVISSTTPPLLSVGSGVYRLVFDEAVTLSAADLSVTATNGGSALLGTVSEVNPRTYDVHIGSLAAAETYDLTVATTVADACGISLAAAVIVRLVVEDPCATDVQGPLLTSPRSPASYEPTAGVYRLTFDEDLAGLLAGDLRLTGVAGPGAATITGVAEVSPREFDVALEGLAHGDLYTLTVSTSGRDVCGNSVRAAGAVVISVVDPCEADGDSPGLASPTTVDVPLGVNALSLVFDEDVVLSGEDLSLSFVAGAGTGNGSMLTVTATTSRRYEVVLADLEAGEAYRLTVGTTVADECGNRLPTASVIQISVVDPCASDAQAPVSIGRAMANLQAPDDRYLLEFDEQVNAISAANLSLNSTGGAGAASIAAVTATDSRTFEVQLNGLVAGDTYDLEVATPISDLCLNNLPSTSHLASFSALARPTAARCASASHTEVESFAFEFDAPRRTESGNSNGVVGADEPFSLSRAEASGINFDILGAFEHQIAGLVEHFDPTTMLTVEPASDLYALGTLTGSAGRRLDVTLSVDGAASSSSWSAAGRGYVELALLDGAGRIVTSSASEILNVGDSTSISIGLDSLELIDGESYTLSVAARPDATPTTVGEYLDYCIALSVSAYAAPPGAQCSSSVDLSQEVFPYTFAAEYTGDGVFGGTCDPLMNNALWFSFTAQQSSDHAVSVANQNAEAWSRLASFSGGCEPSMRTELSCTGAEQFFIEESIAMVQGETYDFVYYTDSPAFSMLSPEAIIEPCASVVASVVALEPASGSADVARRPELLATFDRQLDFTQGRVSITGDKGTDLSFDFEVGTGSMSVLPLSSLRGMRILLPTDLPKGENIVVAWDGLLRDRICGLNPATSAATWNMTITNLGFETLLYEGFDSPSAVAAWSSGDTGACSSSVADQWVHISESTTSGCDDVGSFFASLPDADFAVANADCCGNTMDAVLLSPSVDCSTFTEVQLAYEVGFRPYGSSLLTVEVSIDGGSSWLAPAAVTYDAQAGLSEVIDISAGAAGASDVRVRFHYVAGWDYYTAIDNVAIRGQ